MVLMCGVWAIAVGSDLIYGIDLRKVPFIAFWQRSKGRNYRSSQTQCALRFHYFWKPEFLTGKKKTFRNCNPLDFKFYIGKAAEVT